MAALQSHRPFLIILGVQLLLALAYASLIPLGEAPDEPAHLSYARFIAQEGRLPTTLAEREAAGYRSTWPPLYHSLVAVPLALVGEAPPTRLKGVGDTPRRLIPTDGQTIAAFIHIADEAWPWQGLPLAWRLGRFVSVLLGALSVLMTYLIAWRLTGQQRLAAGAAAFHAFLPQALFIGSVVSDDNLLSLLAGLLVLLVVSYSQQVAFPSLKHFIWLGITLGLATTAKYNAFPLWGLVGSWLLWLNYRQPGGTSARSFLRRLAVSAGALLLGVIFTAGWWFFFIWRNFNQIESQGWWRGSLAALSAGTSDASLRRLAGGGVSIPLPSAAAWSEWGVTFFRSFWGLFGGGGTIAWPDWSYGLLAAVVLLALAGWFVGKSAPLRTTTPPILYLILFMPLFFLPLPLLRFFLTGGNIVETAQGRHLFPALPAIALFFTLGLTRLIEAIVNYKTSYSRLLVPKLDASGEQKTAITSHAPRTTPHVLRFTFYILPLLWLVLLLPLALYSLNRIQAAYPPLLPVATVADRLGTYTPITARLAEEIRLVGYGIEPAQAGVLPVTLLWQAEAIPVEDYLIHLEVTDAEGQLWGSWVGQPVGGRYPTRAWDEKDRVRDIIPVPLLAAPAEKTASLRLSLLDATGQPAMPPLTLTSSLQLPQTPTRRLPSTLRADGLAAAAPFSYRSTISVVAPAQAEPPILVGPEGRSLEPDRLVEGTTGSLAHFIVAAAWPGGDYQLLMNQKKVIVPVVNRFREFETPPMQHILNANFAGQITVLGYDLPQRMVEPGESFPLTLTMRAERPLGQSLVIFNHLLDAQARQRGGVDRIPKAFYTTLLWTPGEIVSDFYQTPVEAGAPPGIYWLDLGFYPDRNPQFSLPLLVGGQPSGRNSILIGPLKVGGPPAGVTVKTAAPQHPLDQLFGDQITLLGFDLGREIAQEADSTGQRRGLRLFWQAKSRPQADYTVFIHLLNAEGQIVAQADGPPAGGAYPTQLWEAGEIIVDERLLPDLSPGNYSLRLGLYQPDSGERLPVAGNPERAVTLLEFEMPGLP